MKYKILSIGAFILLVPLKWAWAADINGNWIVKMHPHIFGMDGLVNNVFSFKVDGTKLTGTVSNSQGDSVISDGRINGDDISFVVMRSFGGSEMNLVYKGKVALNEIKFTCEVQGGMEQPQEFIAKREFQRHGDVPAKIIFKQMGPPY